MTGTRERTHRVRRTADDRRKQLIGIGLRLLTTRPIHQLTIDEVAAEAGISRSLLFHYFPTKQDYYVAVVRAASRRLVRAVAPEDATGTPDERVAAIVTGYVAYLHRRREPYLALFRGATRDDWVRSVHQDTQTMLTARILAALGLADPPPATRLVVKAWWAFAEDLTIEWTGREQAERDALVDILIGALRQVVALATESSRAQPKRPLA